MGNLSVNTMGLSPAELNAISQQRIAREQNVINMLGKAMTHKVSSARQVSDAERDRVLNILSGAQTKELEPLSIQFKGKQYQTTRKNMTQAMKNLRQGAEAESRTEKSEYENTPMEIEVGGRPYKLRRYELTEMVKVLHDQERLNMERDKIDIQEQEQRWRKEGLTELKGSSDISAQTAAKLNNLSTWMTVNKPKDDSDGGLAQQKYTQELRKNWDTLNAELNKPPEGRAKNPVALASSANMIAEELGESVATVVFSSRHGIPGLGNDIKKGAYKMASIRHPVTNELISIKELRAQAVADNMTLNEALQILYIHEKMKEN